MPVKTSDELHNVVKQILVAVGADSENADRVAEGLVSANLSGVDPHGVYHLPGYVKDIREGSLVPDAKSEILNETPTTALVSGNWSFGFVTAKFALDLAIKKAEQYGISIVGIVQCHHIGRLGEYAEIAAEKGMISYTWAGGYSEKQQSTVPFGGRGKVLHTNPLSIGFPAGDETPMVMDFATTMGSGSKIMVAKEKGEQLPPGYILDKDGNPSTNPSDFLNDGSHLPFGGHKGYSIMLAVEFLGRILTGSDDYVESNRGGLYMAHQGITMIVHKADLFQPLEKFNERADEMEKRLRAVPPAPGFSEVLIPGDMEARTREIRNRDGIPLSKHTWESLVEVASSLDVTI